jgi:hypothetical protein
MSAKEIHEITDKLYKKFPQIPYTDMIEIWFEQQNISYSISKESENEYVFKIRNTHFENISAAEFIKFSENMHKKFLEITMNDLVDIWCEHKESKPKSVNICISKERTLI